MSSIPSRNFRQCFPRNRYYNRGHLFWEKANERDVDESDPKSTYREELVRIYEFEKKCGQRFKNEDYFSLWDTIHSTRTQRSIK